MLGHKLNIIDIIILMVTLSVEISRHHMIFLLESFVITSVMSLVYIDKSFSLRYSWMNFTIEIILSVTSYVELTRHRIACLFFISSFPTAILSVYTIRIFLSVFIDGFNDKKNSVSKYYCNILLTEKFYRYFCLYLSIQSSLLFWKQMF